MGRFLTKEISRHCENNNLFINLSSKKSRLALPIFCTYGSNWEKMAWAACRAEESSGKV
jgi:hypothetical protein